jgi:cytidine deaminase
MLVTLDSLEGYEAALLRAAASVRTRAYAPYSRFHVGAAALAASGAIYCGCNVENASYGLTICAEVSAICRAHAEGSSELRALAIVGGPSGAAAAADPVMPCGRCRQWIAEAAAAGGQDIVVLSSEPSLSRIDRSPISALLPGAFALPFA